MALRCRRLGELTPAQERVLESLLVSVADNISELVSAAAARARGGEGARDDDHRGRDARAAPEFADELRPAA